MNFKPTKQKIIGSIIVSIVIAIINYARFIFQGIDAPPINYFNLFLVWIISLVVIYLIWSLFEK